jgi:peptidoglycan/xylan/chitin deacetylase (PgdA/CDA1 family)
MNLKIFLKKSFSALVYYTQIIKLFNKIPHNLIVCYHRILPDDDPQLDFIQPGMYVTTKTFEKHLQYLTRNYQIISVKELNSIQNGCVLSFDDGWADNFHHAYPILKSYKVPAIIFLSTNMIGSTNWPWTDRISYYIRYSSNSKLKGLLDYLTRYQINFKVSIRTLLMQKKNLAENIIYSMKLSGRAKLQNLIDSIDAMMSDLHDILQKESPWLTWEQIREMKQNMIDFGAHTHNHVILTNTSLDDAEKEIIQSKRILAEKIGDPVEIFSYPNGNYNRQIVKLLEQNGYRYAVTTKKGFVDDYSDNFILNRFLLHEDMTSTIPMLACKLTNKFSTV